MHTYLHTVHDRDNVDNQIRTVPLAKSSSKYSENTKENYRGSPRFEHSPTRHVRDYTKSSEIQRSRESIGASHRDACGFRTSCTSMDSSDVASVSGRRKHERHGDPYYSSSSSIYSESKNVDHTHTEATDPGSSAGKARRPVLIQPEPGSITPSRRHRNKYLTANRPCSNSLSPDMALNRSHRALR